MEIEDKEEELKDERFKNLAVGILIIALFLLMGYLVNFYDGDLSRKSSDWGSFGDYFNGLLSPIIGFVTIVLIFRTYKLQKSELRKTQLALNNQIKQAKESAQREMLWKSAEEVYKEISHEFSMLRDWNKISDEEFIGKAILSGEGSDIAEAKIRIIYAPLIIELASYLKAIDELTENDSRSTDYFRRRINKSFLPFTEMLTARDLANSLEQLNFKGFSN